jgi:hypothetical protein
MKLTDLGIISSVQGINSSYVEWEILAADNRTVIASGMASVRSKALKNARKYRRENKEMLFKRSLKGLEV